MTVKLPERKANSTIIAQSYITACIWLQSESYQNRAVQMELLDQERSIVGKLDRGVPILLFESFIQEVQHLFYALRIGEAMAVMPHSRHGNQLYFFLAQDSLQFFSKFR